MTVQAIYGDRVVDPFDLKPGDVDWPMIAIHLSRINRYAGAVEWSVLDHSLLCLEIAASNGLGIHVQRAALIHDIGEALTSDIPSPCMHPSQRGHGQAITHGMMLALGISPKLTDVNTPEVRNVDMAALRMEAEHFFPKSLGHFPPFPADLERPAWGFTSPEPENSIARFCLHVWNFNLWRHDRNPPIHLIIGGVDPDFPLS